MTTEVGSNSEPMGNKDMLARLEKISRSAGFEKFPVSRLARMVGLEVYADDTVDLPNKVELEENLIKAREALDSVTLKWQNGFLRRCFRSLEIHISSLPKTTQKVEELEEEEAFSRLWNKLKRSKEFCCNVEVQYTTKEGTVEEELKDYDGPRNSWLSKVWSTYFANDYMYNVLFEYPNVGEGKVFFLKKANNLGNIEAALAAANKLGWLTSMLGIYNVPGNRPFAFSTFVMMCNEVPDYEAFISLSEGVDEALVFDLERDFRFGWRNKWSYLSSLRASYGAAKTVLDELKDTEDPIFFSLYSLQITELDWKLKVEQTIRKIIWGALFGDRQVLGGAVRDGFFLACDTTSLPEDEKKLMYNDLKLVTSNMLKALFNGQPTLESGVFLEKCQFISPNNEEHKLCFRTQEQLFRECIEDMDYAERSRLCKFITGLEYLGCDGYMKIVYQNRNDAPVPSASTCIQTLYLPPYNNKDVMKSKLIVASFHNASYGFA